MPGAIPIGVSSCLLGEKVRYDGGHKLAPCITEIIGEFARFVPVCPEVESGMPIPREAMHLEGDPENPRLVTVRSGIDKTGEMLEFCGKKVRELEKEELCGFIFKKNSPSCGLFRVKVCNRETPVKTGSGLFAAAVVRRFPYLPVEEEERLNDPATRENFIERVFCCSRWKDFLRDEPDPGKLVQFHTAHKLLLMAHCPAIYRKIGRLVAEAGKMEPAELFGRYEELMMKAMAMQATVAKNTDVLMHVMGYFKKQLSHAEKEELLALIRQYRGRLVPLSVPTALLRHYALKYDEPYLGKQVYLSPRPAHRH